MRKIRECNEKSARRTLFSAQIIVAAEHLSLTAALSWILNVSYSAYQIYPK